MTIYYFNEPGDLNWRFGKNDVPDYNIKLMGTGRGHSGEGL